MSKKETKKFVKVCPRCHSTEVTISDRAALTAYRELYYRCRKCGLEAKLFPEIPVSELEKLRKEKKKEKREEEKK